MFGLNKIYLLKHAVYIYIYCIKNMFIHRCNEEREKSQSLTGRTRRRRKRIISVHAYINRCLQIWCTGKKKYVS